ncbi:MAG: 2-amino-4-hydroxy-6-hydroxymethyldihydropteridine diphosphokinase [Clostridia bacterium]|jgi:2-amino-4-hydroxy-6-hydroxymethyldihydropteridine diphosphokinase|nr:2-amino-4-hydroxy-6-hydroxymethyldihydropteridine diphosphokinase [Clostridia bacterium]MDN5322523.1 2-amino-4-hydroxy-6-hydroxymethyldihydropteridine diphosphokinase [Clostridia bacterium]
MAKAYLGLGSNLGNKKANIEAAIQMLANNEKIKVLKISSYYETEPVGFKEQDWFLNIVVKIETLLDPYELLEFCHVIEGKLQRKRIIRWGPRTIDVDILLYENFYSNNEKLTVPHLRMTERAFVMVPLFEIEPELKLNGENIKKILEQLKGQDIKKLND